MTLLEHLYIVPFIPQDYVFWLCLMELQFMWKDVYKALKTQFSHGTLAENCVVRFWG